MLKANVLNSVDIECTYIKCNIYIIEVPEAREDEVTSKQIMDQMFSKMMKEANSKIQEIRTISTRNKPQACHSDSKENQIQREITFK